MTEPHTAEECLRILRELTQKNPNKALLIFMDQLVDLAVRGGSPIPSPLDEYKKVNFYKHVIAAIIKITPDLG